MTDRIVQMIALWNPAFLKRDTIKMCWRASPLGELPRLSARYSIAPIVSRDAPPEWIDTLTTAGMTVTAPTWANEFADRTDAMVLGVFEGGRLVGTAGIRAVDGAPGVAFLLWVGVQPNHQGQQLGRALVASALADAQRRGFDTVMLLTDDHRLAAIQLYLSFGFKPCLNSWDRTQHFRWQRIARRLNRPVEYCRDATHRPAVESLAK